MYIYTNSSNDQLQQFLKLIHIDEFMEQVI
jgi:hypothetical protein